MGELFVDVAQNKIFPVSKYFTKEQGKSKIEANKWMQGNRAINSVNGLSQFLQQAVNDLFATPNYWDWQVQTTMRKLMDLAKDLVKNHGKYSNVANSCQDFAIHFIEKCAKKEVGSAP